MTANNKTSLIIGILVALFLFALSLYTVREDQRAIVLRLGEILKDDGNQAIIRGPGIHLKIPLLHQARKFDMRIQTKDIDDSRVVTAEKKDVLVNYYAKWRIKDIALYFTRTGGNSLRAETLLEQKLNDGLRAEFGRRTIRDVVSGERRDVMLALQKQADESAHELGIEVVDVRIKRIDLPTEVSSSVYERMRAERERVATEHRAEGKSRAEAIRATADARVTVILATADQKSKEIRGDGDAQAARIYADAYNRNPDFYAFTRSLDAYTTTFNNKRDILVLKPTSQFFQYFNDADHQ
ncbi:MAG: protease modulator HflC [Gammaproteobacteria bacterium]